MAGRPIGSRHQEDIRRKIQASQLINRLTAHALGTVELSNTQVRAIEILLRKCVADLTSVEHTGEVSHKYVAEVPPEAKDSKAWEQENRTLQ